MIIGAKSETKDYRLISVDKNTVSTKTSSVPFLIKGVLGIKSLAPERCQFYIGNFQTNFCEWWLRYLLRNGPQMNATRPY